MITLAYVDAVESRLCVKINRFGSYKPVQAFFAMISRAGDWPFWVLIGVALFLMNGSAAARPAIHMVLTVAVGIWLYKALKGKLLRERPYVSNGHIVVGTPALDRYSFPSGHTQQAICLTTMLASYAPELLPIIVPFAVLVALSRVILGLHYPTDVLAGAAIGFTLAELSLAIGRLV
ncbi:MAG: phosphatase PAP2 family protein [Pseudomonadota bacterium]